MSGIVGSNLNIKGAGLVAKLGTDGQVLTSSGAGVTVAFEDLAAGISWQSVETGSTMTAVAGEGYPIDTSSNACTITLPASASNGDQIIFTDYARNWGTNGIIIDSNGLNYQGEDDTYTVEYGTDGQSVEIVYSGATKGWIPTIDEAVADVPEAPGNPYGMYAFGLDGSAWVSLSNLISNVGVVSTDVSGVGSARFAMGACEYGEDKGIIGFGSMHNGSIWVYYSVTNLVSNTGVVATDTTGVGTAKTYLNGGATYGGDKGIFGFGSNSSLAKVSTTNLISNTGVCSTDVTGVGTARNYVASCEYSSDKDKAIFGFGTTGSATAVTNLVSNTGVVATDVTGVGSARTGLGACDYGGDKGIFGFGHISSPTAVTNLISNVGVVATDTSGVGTARSRPSATQYGGILGIFVGGDDGGVTAVSNLVSNVGVVSTDVAGVGTARYGAPGCSYG